MSSNLYWQVVIRKEKPSLSDRTKHILRKRYGDPVKATLTLQEVDYLQGLIDSGCEDLQDVMDALYKNEEIYLEEVY